MKKVTLFILRDDQDGYRTAKLYLDMESATIALQEHYTDYWIKNKKATIELIEAVSYTQKD